MKWKQLARIAFASVWVLTLIPALAQNSLTPLEKAFVGIGGEEALAHLNSFVLEASGTRWNNDEGFSPDAPTMAINTFSTTVSYDVAGDNLRLDHNDRITAFGLNVPQVFSEIIIGNLGFVAGVDNILGIPERDMLSDRWAMIRKQQRLLNPQLILLDILADPSIASEGGVQLLNGSVHHLLVVEDDVHPITLYVNAATGHLAKASTMENHYLHRDVVLEAFYLGWQPTEAGIRFPYEVFIALNESIILHETRDSVQVNGDLDDALFAFPNGAAPMFDAALVRRGERSSQFQAAFVALGLPQDGVQTFVQATELAPGVFHLTGGSHHSLIVEQDAGIVVVEAPLYGPRSEAIIAWIETSFPGKPISSVIVSHFHEDHAAGARTFVAEGATVVVSEKTASLFTEVFEARSTILPDALELNPVTATIEIVPSDEPLTLADATRPVVVIPVENSHADDLVMTYVPAAGVLFISDIYNPGTPGQLFPTGPAELLASIASHGISVSTIAGGHGAVSSFSDLEGLVNP